MSDPPASSLSSPPTDCISGSLVSWQLGCVLVLRDMRIVEESPEILHVLSPFILIYTFLPQSRLSKYCVLWFILSPSLS